MANLNDLAVEEITKGNEVPEELLSPKPDEVPAQGGFKLDFSWLMKETGPGEIEDYIDHPLNFNASKGLAQIIRGVAGFIGNGSQLKLAVVDVLFGFLKMRGGRMA